MKKEEFEKLCEKHGVELGDLPVVLKKRTDEEWEFLIKGIGKAKNKPLQPTKESPEDKIIEEFDEKFPEITVVNPNSLIVIKDFLRQALQQERTKAYEQGYKDGYDFECECGERIIKAREEERTKVINEYLKSDAGKVYEDYKTLQKMAREEVINEIRLEIASYSKLGVEQTKYLLNKIK
jgi:hypothetical protein